MLRRQAFEQVGGFDERFFLYFEDVDLCLRLRAAGWGLGEAREAGCVHVKGGSQDGASALNLEYRRGQLLYYALHRPQWENAVLRAKLRRRLARLEEPERSGLRELLERPAPEAITKSPADS
ncbi:MAG: glycosyltransferase family 2 protein, partial [Acidobacteriota bacterium]